MVFARWRLFVILSCGSRIKEGNEMLSLINEALLRLSLRAETTDRAHLVQTFVDVGPLFIRFSSRDHQILFGRRGTGKTHALSYLADKVEKKGDISVQIDLRTIGSSGGLYSDPNIALTERATRLLMDVLSSVHDKIRRAVISRTDEFDISLVGPLLDQFAQSITQVVVIGEVENRRLTTDEKTSG
jgi:Cdc6-like AAA superfamily ATPase